MRPLVSLLFTPFNASKSLISISDFRLQSSRGHGAVRELVERILIAKGLWKNYSKNGWIKEYSKNDGRKIQKTILFLLVMILEKEQQMF